MDFTELRAAALREGEAEEAVTVDTRALIDKILARYSGEWTTLRELIQNAADAQATSVKIQWETLPSATVPLPGSGTDVSRSQLLQHTLQHHTLRRLLVENDGQAFTATDWARLKRIAEGNPDETKIGAFGVGFYSVFADCEEPFVSSGRQAMAFFWKANALFTRKLVLPDSANPDDKTTFVLDYRNTTTALPNLLSVSQFLATSLTFVSLKRIEFWIDNVRILDLQKDVAASTPVTVPRNLSMRTKDGLMALAGIERSRARIDATYLDAVAWRPAAAAKSTDTYGLAAADMPSLKSFFARLTSGGARDKRKDKARDEQHDTTAATDLMAERRASIALLVTSAAVQTSVPAGFAAELTRATKKPPPKVARMAVLTSSYGDVRDVRVHAECDIFASVLPSQKPGGRIFIGFPTQQTTGGGMHVSAPSLIPTVEREAIDLNARWVRTWNMELLRAAGILSRVAFVGAMRDLDTRFKGRLVEAQTRPADEVVDKVADEVAAFVPEALHVLATYTFGDSTPSAHVAKLVEESFWTAGTEAVLDMFSTAGVLPTTRVRMESDEISLFAEGIPVVPAALASAPFVQRLREFGILEDVSVSDVCGALEARALGRSQLVHFVRWLASRASTRELDAASVRSLLRVAVAAVAGDDDEDDPASPPIALRDVQHFLSGSKVPAGVPLPPSAIPFWATTGVPLPHLTALGWTQLDLQPWVAYLMDKRATLGEHDMTTNPAFAAQVLHVLSKNWDNMSVGHKTQTTALLQAHTVMPTKQGMRRPAETFFPTVKLFDDLPVLAPSCHALKERFLLALGVRKTIDLDTIFRRLMRSDSVEESWSHVELVKYLASVAADIPEGDLRRLRETPFCPAEAGPPDRAWSVASTQKYRACDLFEPGDAVRALGFPIVQWPDTAASASAFRRATREAAFLGTLGLRRTPSVADLLGKMAADDASLRDAARAYFVKHYTLHGYGAQRMADVTVPFLPIAGGKGDKETLVPPSACFANAQAAVLGFNVLRADLVADAAKFGVAHDPPVDACVARLLAHPPASHDQAVAVFGYLSSRIGSLNGDTLRRLQQGAFVPVSKQTDGVRHARPDSVYLGTSSTYGEIFDFVDFGTTGNAFLFKCGSRTEPTKTEIAQLAVNAPARLLSTLQTTERYLALLRSLAEDLPRLKSDRELFRRMKAAPFLLASKEVESEKTESEKEKSDENDDPPIRQFQLARAADTVVLDDIISYRLFKDRLLVAPEEDALEALYVALGAPMLSAVVREDVAIGAATPGRAADAEQLRRFVLERSKLFLFEYKKYRADVLRRDTKWLEQHLVVRFVDSVSLRRALTGSRATHAETRSAAASTAKGEAVLYVSSRTRPDMYQVGQAVCQFVLARQSQQAYLFFEPFLKLDLLELRARGYNVDRVLRAKAAEARIAEAERQRAVAAEQARDAEKSQPSQPSRNQQSQPSQNQQSQTRMPGTFDSPPGAFDSPPETQMPQPDQPDSTHPDQPDSGSQFVRDLSKAGNDLFASLTRRFGGGDASQPSPSDTNQPAPSDDGRVTSPAAIQQNMRGAIQAARPYGSSGLFAPPATEMVKEKAAYCDHTPAQNMTHVATAPRGMGVFLSRDLSRDAAAQTRFLAAEQRNIAAFELLLRDVAAVYGLASGTVHIYYDAAGPTIAFNLRGSIFCNLRYFAQLHADSCTASPAQRAEATVWWWVVVAHELAHNLESSHNAQHSYYTESFVQQYFGRMVATTAAWGGNSARDQLNQLASR